MQREEKIRDSLLESLQLRLHDLKQSIGFMIQKLETEFETINWPTFLDNFALISSHLTGLSKILANEMGPPLRNLTVLPLLLSPEHDDALWKLTEGRIGVFSHDMVPDYLRTKPDPAAEQRMLQHEQKANSLNVETAVKQVAQYTKVVAHVFDMVAKAREEWEVEASGRTGVQQTSSLADTQALVSAVGMGKGLKGPMTGVGGGSGVGGVGGGGIGGGMGGMGGGGIGGGGGGVGGMGGGGIGGGGGGGLGGVGGGMGGSMSGGMMVPPAMRAQAPMSAVSPGAGVGPMNKAPSAIKTNIKSANAIHPYGR